VKAYMELLAERFQSKSQINNFLIGIAGVYTAEQLEEMLLVLYKGYGVL
jgi:hypothetical protein